jgi:CBS domain-containing protein
MTTTERAVVADIMTTPIETVKPDASLIEAAKTIGEKEIGALLVTTAPPSIVTATDVLEAVAQGRDTSELDVADVMTESVETVPPDLSLNETAAMMDNFRIDHLPVLEDDYVGMVSSTAIVAHLA